MTMSDDAVERDPPIHILTEDGKLRICFSHLMKIGIAVAGTVIGALLLGAFGFAWKSHEKLAGIETSIRGIEARLSGQDGRMDRMDGRIDNKQDRR